jgi:hypothetical protein
LVQVPATIGRAKLEQTSAGLRIVIPAFRHLYNFWQAVILRPVLALICVAMLWRIFADSPVFMAFTTTAVTIGVTSNWAWKGLGKEIITVNRAALTLRWEIAGIGWTHQYFSDRIAHMRFSTAIQGTGKNTLDWNYVIFDYQGSLPWTDFVASFAVLFFGRGRSYNPRAPRFGRGLSESEGQDLVRAVQSVAVPAHQLA